jgi:tetratricopeptide (TPR) repeat protein
MTTAPGRHRALFITAAVFMGLLLPALAAGQEDIIKGFVGDGAGNPLKNARITLTDLTSGNRFSFKSGKDGKIFKVGIPPASYKLTVELEGYLPYEQPFQVTFGEQHVLSVTLEKIPPKIDEDKDFIEGSAFFKEARYAEAEASFKKVTERYPEIAAAYFNHGLSAVRAGHREEGLASLESAVLLDPRMIEAHFVLGEEYFASGERDKAKAAFDRAIALDPSNPKAYYNLGIIFYKSGRLDDALASFGKAVELDPAFSSAHYQAGLIHVGKGEFAAAVVCFEKFLEVEPDAPEAGRVKAMIEELKKQIEKKE